MKQGWEIKKLGEVCTIKGRIGFRGYTREDLVAQGEGAITLSPSNIIDDVLSFDKCQYISWFKYEESPEIQIFNGDIIYAKTASIGKVALVKDLPEKATINPQFVVFKDIKCNSSYLYYVVRGENFKHQISLITNGVAIPTVSQKNMANLLIPVPPLPEQEKIVAELDCLSGIIEKKKQQLKEYDALAQSIFYEMFGNPIDNEKGWEVKKLGEVCDVRDGTHDSPKYLEQSDYVLITSKNIVGNTIDFTSANHISEDDYININKRSCVNDGDIIMAMIGTIGNPIIVKDIDRKFCIKNVALIKFAQSTLVTNVYIRALLDNKCYYQYIQSQNKGGTQKFVALGTVRNFTTPIPPLALQQEFASKIEAIEKQKELIKQSIVETETLFNSRMDFYFN